MWTYFRRLWRRVHEPRARAFIYTFVYALFVVAGTSVLIQPVATIEGQIGQVMTGVWGTLLLVGGLAGIAGATIAPRWVEMAGTVLCITSLALYAGAVWWIVTQGHPGNRVAQACLLTALALVLTDQIRWLRSQEASPIPAAAYGV